MLKFVLLALTTSVLNAGTEASAFDSAAEELIYGNFSVKIPLDESGWRFLGDSKFVKRDPTSYLLKEAPRIRLLDEPIADSSYGAIWSRSAASKELVANSGSWQLDVLLSGRSFLHGSQSIAILFATNDSLSETDGKSFGGKNGMGINETTFDGFGVVISMQYQADPLQPEIILRGINGRSFKNSSSLVQIKCWAFSMIDLLSRKIRFVFRKDGTEIKVRFLSACGRPSVLTLDLGEFTDANEELHAGVIASSHNYFGTHLDLFMFEFSNTTNTSRESDYLEKDFAIAYPNFLGNFKPMKDLTYEPLPLPSPPLFGRSKIENLSFDFTSGRKSTIRNPQRKKKTDKSSLQASLEDDDSQSAEDDK